MKESELKKSRFISNEKNFVSEYHVVEGRELLIFISMNGKIIRIIKIRLIEIERVLQVLENIVSPNDSMNACEITRLYIEI